MISYNDTKRILQDVVRSMLDRTDPSLSGLIKATEDRIAICDEKIRTNANPNDPL